MQDEVGGQARWRRLRDVPVGVGESDDVVCGEGLDERGTELSAGAGD